MKVPPLDKRLKYWPEPVVEAWVKLREQAQRLNHAAVNSDPFADMQKRFRAMAQSGRFEGMAVLMQRRLGARALTALWSTDGDMRIRLLNRRMLDTLIQAQQPRLTRLTLIQLLQLYFKEFDLLDSLGRQSDQGLRKCLHGHLLEQLRRMPGVKQPKGFKDIVSAVQQQDWLLDLDAPMRLIKIARENGHDFDQCIQHFGLEGFDGGRYGDICRAHYYLETLSGLEPGEHHPVLDELLKPSVCRAPYNNSKRIGHAALGIMIDRVKDEPGEIWQNFILQLAGDPRIASSAPAYREWWQPLGQERIAKVRGWLSREDLKLFLQAVEQYGIESGNHDLQRMFPARKRFLEGLFNLKLIRNSRLLLGYRAMESVRSILGKDVLTSFANLDGGMSDKAVIYLDCGDFYLVEGSHSFKIWVYLACPSALLTSYQRASFSHAELTSRIPAEYQRTYPGLPYEAYVHSPNVWQNRVFCFLAENGIELDIESLLSPTDYRYQLQRYGIPAVNPLRTKIPEPQLTPQKHTDPQMRRVEQPNSRRFNPDERVADSNSAPAQIETQHKNEQQLQRYGNPSMNPRGTKVRESQLPQSHTNQQTGSTDEARIRLYSPDEWVADANSTPAQIESQRRYEQQLQRYDTTAPSPHSPHAPEPKCTPQKSIDPQTSRAEQPRISRFHPDEWVAESNSAAAPIESQPEYEQLIESGDTRRDGFSRAAGSVTPPKRRGVDLKDTTKVAMPSFGLKDLTAQELRILRYFARHPAERVRIAQRVLGIEPRDINAALHGKLRALVTQNANFGWTLTTAAKKQLEAFDMQELRK